MQVVAIVFSSLCFLLSFILIPKRLIASPCCAFLGLLIISMAKTPEGFPLLPFSQSLIFGWLCVAVLVTVVTLCQPRPVRYVNKGWGYISGGALTGLAIGLLGFSISNYPGIVYAIMIIAVAVGTFFGYIIFTRTPDGSQVRVNSGNFFTYLLAKGFPIAITFMQAGVVLVMIISMHNPK